LSIVDGDPDTSPHLALVTLREFTDADSGAPPFEVAVLRSLVTDMSIESAVTTADLRITWASPALEARAGEGALVGRVLHEVTSARERDVLVGLARQAVVRGSNRSPLVRALPTGRRVGVADHTRDAGLAGLLWWWLSGPDAPADLDRMTAVDNAVNRFIDDLAWAGVETTRLSAKAVDSMSAAELLTPREREILEMLSSGLRAPTIATKLFLSPSTVRNHLSTAFRKVGVTSQAEFFELVARKDGSKRQPRARGPHSD
jgi:DNA-binding CsgD family transcriptional regulator